MHAFTWHQLTCFDITVSGSTCLLWACRQKYAVNFLSYRGNLITLVACCQLSAGRRRRWPSRKAKSYHRFPDPHHTCVAGTWRKGRASYRGVPPSYPHPGGLRHPTQESQLRILNHHHYHSANEKSILCSLAFFLCMWRFNPPWVTTVI